ncbi:hypothetical protein B0T10DRAFT_66149 [Thelonectria olida]|uniref:Uncharacterized protein n=1 Tax=Thelonectria olida TaxID=1576542 RepID=A0A9P8W2Z2_9HYPO|nr:hypothetical protein B0T10DRAFT_66149 [Thelonectria olida]
MLSYSLQLHPPARCLGVCMCVLVQHNSRYERMSRNRRCALRCRKLSSQPVPSRISDAMRRQWPRVICLAQSTPTSQASRENPIQARYPSALVFNYLMGAHYRASSVNWIDPVGEHARAWPSVGEGHQSRPVWASSGHTNGGLRLTNFVECARVVSAALRLETGFCLLSLSLISGGSLATKLISQVLPFVARVGTLAGECSHPRTHQFIGPPLTFAQAVCLRTRAETGPPNQSTVTRAVLHAGTWMGLDSRKNGRALEPQQAPSQMLPGNMPDTMTEISIPLRQGYDQR